MMGLGDWGRAITRQVTVHSTQYTVHSTAFSLPQFHGTMQKYADRKLYGVNYHFQVLPDEGF